MKFLNVCHVLVVVGLLSVLDFTECQQQCVDDNGCQSFQSCANRRCVNPCVGACGLNSYCVVSNHQPICSCYVGFSGDPNIGCFLGSGSEPSCVDGPGVCN